VSLECIQLDILRRFKADFCAFFVQDRACSPLLPEPDMALNLEIADVILAKKANTYVHTRFLFGSHLARKGMPV